MLSDEQETMVYDRAARIAELEELKADGHLDKTSETELRVLTEARNNEEQFCAWWESHHGPAGFWDYTGA